MMYLIMKMILSFSLVQASTLETKLKAFHKNPKQFYMRHIPKYDSNGSRVKRTPLKTERVSEVAKIKMKYRNKFFYLSKLARKYTARPTEDDNANALVDGAHPINNVFEVESKGLNQSSLDQAPWSGDYWPLYRGILGNRYLDESRPYLSDWKEFYDYSTQFNFYEIFQSENSVAINALSVSEKYDLMTGDRAGTLTQAMWDQGREYYEVDGSVESWMGICHGWAAAAVMVPRPYQSIQVMAFDGKTKLNFNPSELKGLASYLWANADFPRRFIGGRCNFKDVKRDENGRPLAPECFDTNPATWFISVVNQIGIAQRGFVMDATPDYEVWNQPVYGYKIQYFNPETLTPSDKLSDSIIERESFTKDKFKKYRTNNAVKMVGIEMTVQYLVEESANARTSDTPLDDNFRTVTYIFDLELDAKGKILGGEWYEAEHPDFLWIPDKSAQADGPEDAYLDASQWNGYDALPSKWREFAQSAARDRRVLSSIANKLLSRAQ